MKVQKDAPALVLKGEDEIRMIVSLDNRGEPYRDGLSLEVYDADRYQTVTHIFLETHEAVELRDKLNEFFK